jgi:AcrR family transcriptional regulator
VTSPPERSPNALSLRERKKRATRASLIGATLKLVAERGLSHVTVEEISAAANVSVRTFFNYFRNKEDALTGGGVIAGERLTKVLREAPPELSALAAVQQAMLAEARAVEKDPEELILVLTIADQAPSLKPQLVAAGETVHHNLAAAIGQRTGLDPSTDGYPGLVAAVSVATFRQTLFRWHDGGRIRPLTELLEDAFGALAKGLPEPI